MAAQVHAAGPKDLKTEREKMSYALGT